MADMKTFLKAVRAELSKLGLPMLNAYCGETFPQVLETIAESPSKCVVVPMVDGGSVFTSNASFMIKGVGIAVFFCCSYELADIDAEKSYLDHIEDILKALHQLRVENQTLKAAKDSFTLTDNKVFLAFALNFEF